MEGQCNEELSIEDYESPVKYWQERSRRAMEAMGMAVVRPGPVPLPPGVKRELKGNCDELPIGLVCNACSTRMHQFTRLVKCTVHYYDENATVPFKLFLYCVNMKCKAEIIVERNREVKDYVVLSGATRYFPPANEGNSGSRVRLPIVGSSSASRSEDGDHGGDRALNKKEKSTGDRALKKKEKNTGDRAPGSNADDPPIYYHGKIYLGGPRSDRRLRRAEEASERRLLRIIRRQKLARGFR